MLTLKRYIAGSSKTTLTIAHRAIHPLAAALAMYSRKAYLTAKKFLTHVRRTMVSVFGTARKKLPGKAVTLITFGTAIIIVSHSAFTTTNLMLARYSGVVYELSLAWLAAWIFNLLIIDIPRRQERRKIYSGVGWMVNQIAWSGMSMVEALSLCAGVNIRLDPVVGGAINPADRVACERICEAIGPNTPYPPIPGAQCWALIVESTKQSREWHRRIQPWLSTFDAEVNAAMNSVILSSLSQICESTQSINNSTLEVFANYLYDHWKACDDLMNLYYAKVLPYVSGSGETLSRRDRKKRTWWTDKKREINKLHEMTTKPPSDSAGNN